jgi:hypothetical protein
MRERDEIRWREMMIGYTNKRDGKGIQEKDLFFYLWTT